MINKIIKNIIASAIVKSGYNIPVGFEVAEPPKDNMGHYSTNASLIIANMLSADPRSCAEKISKNISDKIIKKVEIAGPGYLNIFLNSNFISQEFNTILEQGNQYGSIEPKDKKLINIEYISANPTGPVHIGNARGGPVGECLANLLSFVGNKITRSFYVNDIGGQIDLLIESFYYWYMKETGNQIPFPEGGYPGEYVKDTVINVIRKHRNEFLKMKDKDEIVALLREKGIKEMINNIKKDAGLLDIKYDEFIYQSDLEKDGQTAEAIKIIEQKGYTEKREGALWFIDHDGLDKESSENVLRKSDGQGTLTYFADDIACHKYKIDKGADIMIDVLGPGHHGHIERMKASIKALGYDPNRLKIIMYQNVRIKNGEEIIKMSKRQGNFILLRDVIKSGVGADAFKYIILSQNNNTPIDFDIKMAKDKSEKNPVFYIQYAHARISSILAKADNNKQKKIDVTIFKEKSEIALLNEIIKFKDIVYDTASDFELQRLPRYAYRVATKFHDFYANCRVLEAEADLKEARIALITATKHVLCAVLKICSISTPEKM